MVFAAACGHPSLRSCCGAPEAMTAREMRAMSVAVGHLHIVLRWMQELHHCPKNA